VWLFANPEQPVVPFAIRVDNATAYERAIHRILIIWNRWNDHTPGTEWFRTSKSEILDVVVFLDNPPSSVAPSNNGVETDAERRGSRRALGIATLGPEVLHYVQLVGLVE